MPEKRAYGVLCWSCKQQVPAGYVWLESAAQIEDLHKTVEANKGLADSVVCENLVGGRVCNAANTTTRDELVFVDNFQWVLEPGADSLSRE